MLVSFIGDQSLYIGWIFRCGKDYIFVRYLHGTRIKRQRLAHAQLMERAPAIRLNINGV